WNRVDKDDILKENNSLNSLIDDVINVKKKITANIELLNEEIEDDMLEVINSEYDDILKEVDRLRIDTYLSGEFDKNDCFLEIHAGAGGTEACDWADMLLRMYERYLSKNDYKYTLIDKQLGEEVGIKSAMLEISGKNAYGYLKGEIGVHRLVRISPFDANKRRHTSFASVLVTPKFDNNIDININDSDIRVDIYRSSGPGGQGVNTTDSAVRITHIPTGIVVTCQNERSQIRNREIAMEVLKNKLYSLELEKQNKEIKNIQGDMMTIGFGSGKRSYVMCPYTLVKDNDSGFETSNVDGILDGDIGLMLEKNIRR
ncbi:MAG: peptide chain release factor 2, partial [Bacilli bacterium]|nr:peptide chain release factor 2 [Bacilli bacterium]